MRIAIDGRELHGQPTGVGRFLKGVMAAWSDLPAARSHEFILLAPGARRGASAWEQLTLPRLVRDARADVLFAPGYTGPLRCPVPMVVVIYDVSFAVHPEWFPWREGLRRRLLTRLAARRAARVVTTSAFSRDEIGRRLGVPHAKIEVIYPGVHTLQSVGRAFDRGPHRASLRGGVEVRPADPKGPPRNATENLVLYVGSLFARRHIPELVEGFADLARRRPEARLEVVGDNRTRPRLDVDRLVSETGAADRIAVRSYVPDEALAALYDTARVFVFLSEYEGFGLTPLEALTAGVPIVVLDTPVAREVYADAALYVPRPDPALVAAAIERLLDDDGERTRILDAARRLLPRYSWRECATRILNLLVAAAS
ncbi:MAG: glycosyltransferase family 4 protein [Acidobacteria bacterium]|nr:glycosyltransferase family 4 protein [Acidobacteriota bacterium]